MCVISGPKILRFARALSLSFCPPMSKMYTVILTAHARQCAARIDKQWFSSQLYIEKVLVICIAVNSSLCNSCT